jgi:hypothetical protein
MSSGSFGHRSSVSRMPSSSLSRIGAAVVVLEAVAVLGVRALVHVVEDAVAVAVAVAALGAAVVVVVAVLVLGDHRAVVHVVEDAVVVVVQIGAAVFVQELVEVLRVVRAVVDVVLDAVAVAIADRGLEHEAEEAVAAARA